jgi:hypothetical protein
MNGGGPGPIFLAGADRSGIGLLGEILECHPDIAMTRRTNFWVRYWGRFGDLRRTENVDRCLQAMTADRRMRMLEPDRDRLLADLAADPTYRTLFASLQRQRTERLGRTVWGDKSLGSEADADRILTSFPTARMVHVIRDPRDRYASYAHHRAGGRGGVGAGAATWLHSVRLARRHLRRYPDRYLVVRYERLVHDPGRTIRDVCAFLGVDARGLVRDDVPGAPPALRPGVPASGPIHTRSVGRFAERLTRRELIVLQVVTGRRMRRCGYAHAPVGLADGDGWRVAATVRFALAELPVDLLRAAVWGPRARLLRTLHRPGSRRP